VKAGAAGFFPIPKPQTLGSFVILVTVLAFIAGWLRNELALTLLGTVFLTILVYCFFGIFFLGIIQRRKARSLSLVVVSETAGAGKEGGLLIKTGSGDPPKKNYFWRFPAILIRCELKLETKDGRVIRHYADPGMENYSSFPAKERGAYYSGSRAQEYDRLVIFDAPGLFSLSLPAGKPGGNARLLVLPQPGEEPIHFSLKSGGIEQRNEYHYRKSEERTDNRPYVPGDDPRRINWKLYSHAPLGELLVREGEPEPPPHSRILLLIDTEVDRNLYTADEGRQAVDLLCESALAAALEFTARGLDILIGYTTEGPITENPAAAGSGLLYEGGIIGGREESSPLNASELAAALAWPAAIPVFRGVLPDAPGGMAALILALPRSLSAKSTSEASALDRFLKKREGRQETDIVFIFNLKSQKTGAARHSEREKYAGICVNLYNRRSGVHAEKILINPGEAI